MIDAVNVAVLRQVLYACEGAKGGKDIAEVKEPVREARPCCFPITSALAAVKPGSTR